MSNAYMGGFTLVTLVIAYKCFDAQNSFEGLIFSIANIVGLFATAAFFFVVESDSGLAICSFLCIGFITLVVQFITMFLDSSASVGLKILAFFLRAFYLCFGAPLFHRRRASNN